MTGLFSRLAFLLSSWLALAFGGAAWAQITVTDSVTTSTTCTQASAVASASGTTYTFTPSGCLTSTPPTSNGPVFSVRLASAATTQPSTGTAGVQTVLVFVDADRDVPTNTTYSLTLNLCTSAQGCTSAGSGNWYFFLYPVAGGNCCFPQDQLTTGTFSFVFQPGANTNPANLRSMGIGHFDVPNTPLFSGTRSLMFSLSGAQAAANVVTHTITGGQQATAGSDLDINGNPIPNTPLSTTAFYQCELLGQPGSPGPNTSNPCGAYQIPVGDCSTGMTGANAITKAYLLQLEDYTASPQSSRIGNSMRMGFARDAAMVFKFKTGPLGTFPVLPRNFGVGYDDQTNRGPGAPRFVTVSQKKCDFDYNNLDKVGGYNAVTSCYQAQGGPGSLQGYVTATGADPTVAVVYCQLKPDTMYYLNIRYENASASGQRGLLSCPAGQNAYNACGTVIGFQ